MQAPAVLALPSFYAYNVLAYTEDLASTLGAFPSQSTLDRVTTSCSFVRSVSMDTWQEEQIKRMQVRSALRVFSWSPHNYDSLAAMSRSSGS